MITQASQVSILVRDLEEAKQFYTRILGYIVRDEIEFSPR
ncbi:VOC family protein [Geomicrobium sp. JCM 19038]|nr:VOC family protein [Geomicrobium sp. JCM 19038]